MVAFANDLALLVEAEDGDSLVTEVEYAVDTIKGCMLETELNLVT